MARRLDVLNIGDPAPRPRVPAMPSACESHGCGGPDEAPPPPPAFGTVRIDGTEIDEAEIAREMQFHPSGEPEAAWLGAARALVVRQLLSDEAARRGIDPAVLEGSGKETDEDLLLRALMADEPLASPSEAECRRFYAANRARFATPELFEAAHILVEPAGNPPGEREWAEAHAEVEAIIAEVGNDRSAFAEAARGLSDCPTGQQDGSLGQVRRGELAREVHQAIEALEPGTTTRGPVRSSFGWHALHLDRRIPGRELPFEMMRDKIVELLEARAWTAAAMGLVNRLASAAVIAGVQLVPGPAQ